MKHRSDEETAAAILATDTLQEAAESLEISPRALYDRMNRPSFVQLYTEARQDILRSAVIAVTNKLTEATNTVTEIMQDQDNPPSVRLQAAKLIIDAAVKLTAGLDQTTHATRVRYEEIDVSEENKM